MILVSGHLVDTPDRLVPRFPADREDHVTREIARILAEWDVGPGWVLLCGGARGADIIAAEQAYLCGASIELLLSLDQDRFEAESVALEEGDWVGRFRSLLSLATVRSSEHELGPLTPGEDPFARTNEWLLAEAAARAGELPFHAILVWNGRAGDGAGGTAHMAELLRGRGARLAIVDPLGTDGET